LKKSFFFFSRFRSYIIFDLFYRKWQKGHFQDNLLAENALFALFSTKIRTWTLMPLKGHIIATFRGLLSDSSLRRNGKKSILSIWTPVTKRVDGAR
jgi:hypothetical protein